MTQFMKRLCAALTLTFCFFAATDHANAQNLNRGKGIGQSGYGTDVWTTTMAGLGLFRAHRDNCNTTTEVFIKLYTNANSVDFGFCIDKDEHSAGSLQWEDARQECLDDGKRLPEIAEYKFACDIGTGLSNMTDDFEFGSNFPNYLHSTNSAQGLMIPGIGATSCNRMGSFWIGNLSSTSNTAAFRCVR